MPQPSHYQRFTAIGQVQAVIRKGPALTWVPLLIDEDEPVTIAVALLGPPPAGLAKHDLVWLTGRWRMEREAGARHGLPYVVVQHLERLKARAAA